MDKVLGTLICFLLSVGIASAQVQPGTVSSKTLDGVGNKITSTVTGLNRGLDVNCLAGCGGGAAGTTDINVIQLLGVAPGVTNPFPQRLSTGTAYYDARDRNWTLASGTDSVSAVQSGTWNIGTLTSITNPVAVTGTFFQATQPVSGSLGRTWTLSSGTDSVAATVSNSFLLDATYTGRMPAGASPADNESNTNTALSRIGAFAYVFDGAAWDRWTGAVTQSGTWNIGTVTAVTSITNPVAVTNAGLTNLDVGLSTRLAEATFTTRINTLGQKTMANSTPVVLPSDQAAIPVTVLSTVASANNDGACSSGAANFTALASNASRTWAAIWASPANTDDVYIKLGVTATSSDARFAPGQTLNFTSGRIYTGIVDAFPASGTQAVCVMELN